MKLRSRINEFFDEKLIKSINNLCQNKVIASNNAKVDVLRKMLTDAGLDFAPIGPGTNRYAILVDGYVIKIALDSWGLRDNLNEFAMCNELQPYVIKVYECNSNGLLMVCEYVTVIDKDDYNKLRPHILNILCELSQGYLLGDVGYITKNYMNWGYTDDGNLVILDFAYIYRVIGNEMLCNAEGCSHPYVEYNEVYSEMFCPECHKKYTFMDIRRRYKKEDEEKFIMETKDFSYSTQDKELIIEDSNEVKEESNETTSNKEPIDYSDEDFDWAAFSYKDVLENNEIEAKDVDLIRMSGLELEDSYYNEEVYGKFDENQFNKEDKTMSEFLKEMARIAKGGEEAQEEDRIFGFPAEDNSEEDDMDAYTALLERTRQQKMNSNVASSYIDSAVGRKAEVIGRPVQKNNRNINSNNNRQNNFKNNRNDKPKNYVPKEEPKEEVSVKEEKPNALRDLPMRNEVETLNEEVSRPTVPEENTFDTSAEITVPDVKEGEEVTEMQKAIANAIMSEEKPEVKEDTTPNSSVAELNDSAVIKNEEPKKDNDVTFKYTPAPKDDNDETEFERAIREGRERMGQ